MKSLQDTIKEELKNLYYQGLTILYRELTKREKLTEDEKKDFEEKIFYKKHSKECTTLNQDYQKWYSLTLPVINKVIPERYDEFIEQYKIAKRKEIDYLTYTISDYLIGLTITRGKEEVVDTYSAFTSKFQQQIFILESAQARIESKIADIEGVLQSELFENELQASEDLLKKNHIRPAGTLAGVTLETHLKKICRKNMITFRKKNPTISDYNDALKEKSIIDIPNWRFIQRLGDIRNLCVHSKDREPKKEEVDDLIQGTKRVISTIN